MSRGLGDVYKRQNKVCDYLQTKGNILKRSGPYVRESDEETDEDETTYNTEFDPEKVAALKELFREQANQLTSRACSHKHAVPINQCKTDDAKNRASEEKARDMVRHAMANWSRWMRSC